MKNPPPSFGKKRPSRPPISSRRHKSSSSSSPDFWIYGIHACCKALQNPQRRITRLLCVQGSEKALSFFLSQNHIDLDERHLKLESYPLSTFEGFLPLGAVHQKIALLATSLPTLPLERFLPQAPGSRTFLCLDHVTDPHNVGAILRSCAAFDIDGVCLTQRHSPDLTGILAKTASGAMETLPLFFINNLSQTLELFKKHNYWCIGLAEEATNILGIDPLPERVVFVLGSEGKGLRQLTRKNCDILVSIPTSPAFPTLNVSVAAGICLFENAKTLQKNKEE